MQASATDFIPLMIPALNDADIALAVRVLKSGMLVQGKEVEKLEKRFADYIGVEHAIAVSNGTASLHLALLALGIGKGDEVIVPAFSYIATANVVELVGATPVFVDIEKHTFNIDVAKIEAAITSRTKAILPVHEFGLSCDIARISEIAKKHNLFLIEDAACSLGATEGKKQTGSFGQFGSFSLHPRKSITSGEGGILTTNDAELAATIRILRNHGIQTINGKMEFVVAGFNYRMTDFQAALASSQFKRLEIILEKKRKLARRYLSGIKNPLIQLPATPADKVHTWQTFHVVLQPPLDRDKGIEYLKSKGIGSNYGAQCMPAQTYYSKKYNSDCAKKFPNALLAWKQGLALPLYDKLMEEQVDFICTVLNELE